MSDKDTAVTRSEMAHNDVEMRRQQATLNAGAHWAGTIPRLTKKDSAAVGDLTRGGLSELLVSAPTREQIIADIAMRIAPETATLQLRHGVVGWAGNTFDMAEELYAEGVRRGIYEAAAPSE